MMNDSGNSEVAFDAIIREGQAEAADVPIQSDDVPTEEEIDSMTSPFQRAILETLAHKAFDPTSCLAMCCHLAKVEYIDSGVAMKLLAGYSVLHHLVDGVVPFAVPEGMYAIVTPEGKMTGRMTDQPRGRQRYATVALDNDALTSHLDYSPTEYDYRVVVEVEMVAPLTDDEIDFLAAEDDANDCEMMVEMVIAAVRRLEEVADTCLGDCDGRREEMGEALDVLGLPSRTLHELRRIVHRLGMSITGRDKADLIDAVRRRPLEAIRELTGEEPGYCGDAIEVEKVEDNANAHDGRTVEEWADTYAGAVRRIEQRAGDLSHDEIDDALCCLHVEGLTVPVLRLILRKLGKRPTGRKADLIECIRRVPLERRSMVHSVVD